jgi:hypothetical protein
MERIIGHSTRNRDAVVFGFYQRPRRARDVVSSKVSDPQKLVILMVTDVFYDDHLLFIVNDTDVNGTVTQSNYKVTGDERYVISVSF